MHQNSTIKWFQRHGASEEVLNILRYGVELAWKPTADFSKITAKKNNRSAYENSSFVTKKLRGWISEGSCQIIDPAVTPVTVISPLSVASRYCHRTQTAKLR